jgi:hypothetical protein
VWGFYFEEKRTMSQFYKALEAGMETSTQMRYSIGQLDDDQAMFVDATAVEHRFPTSVNVGQLIRMTLTAVCNSGERKFLEMETFGTDRRAIPIHITEKFGWDILTSRIVKVGPDLHLYGWAVVVDDWLSDGFESAGFEPSFNFHIEGIEGALVPNRTPASVIDPRVSQIDYSVALSEPVDSVSWQMLNRRIADHLSNTRD